MAVFAVVDAALVYFERCDLLTGRNQGDFVGRNADRILFERGARCLLASVDRKTLLAQPDRLNVANVNRRWLMGKRRCSSQC